jgi:hypothetical protein
MPAILVGTEDGIHTAGGEPAPARFPGRAVDAMAADPSGTDGVTWVVLDGRELWRAEAGGEGRAVASTPGPALRCLAAPGGTVLAGTAEAHLLRLEAGELRRLDSFDRVEARDGWYTPWGGPPDVRSVAVGADGGLWVNVHVGGIPTSPDGGRTWRPTIDVDADVHQVVAHPDDPGRVLAATARGLADSADAGRNWTYLTAGMHARDCRAVALAGDTVVVSASTGPGAATPPCTAGRWTRRRRRPSSGAATACASGSRATSTPPAWAPARRRSRSAPPPARCSRPGTPASPGSGSPAGCRRSAACCWPVDPRTAWFAGGWPG